MSLTTYRNPDTPKYPFCAGCGHGAILDHLNAALVRLQLDPHRVVLVTDIGCVGMSDQYFATHTFHGLHGRSIAYATGIKLANPDLKVVVLIGDGGCGIGGAHLLNAARRNIGLTVLVFNNFNFGMTGGEHSATTPQAAVTATTRAGNLERPLDLCATVAANGAAYVYRGTQFDKDLSERIAAAIQVEGFSLLDIWELCTAYYVPNNRFSKAEMLALAARLGMPLGLVARQDSTEFAAGYRAQSAAPRGRANRPPEPLEKGFEARVSAPTRIVLAGSAGGKVRSTAALLARAAMLCGLWSTQRDDYPTTVMSGHSVSEVIVSPAEIFYTGITKPDILAILTPEGLRQVQARLAAMGAADRVYVMPDFAGRVKTSARKIVFRDQAARVPQKGLALTALAALLRDAGLIPLEALEAAVRLDARAEIVADNLRALDYGSSILD